MESIGVLFVCTGNICRSPTAEAVFRHLVQSARLEDRFVIDSAGTHGYHIGDPPDPRSVATAMKRGVDMRPLRARKVEDADFSRFHYILAMDGGHQRILSRFPAQPPYGALSLFLGGGDVPDPYYGVLKGFEHVYDLIEEGSRRLLSGIRASHQF
ncbi:MAG TPA: low molecular weight protein-tyrosine-phosphatase [Micavibrio sp.]|nr:low molecular weight protein-tyrosine-phosphatase [Micavibrio sp.]